MTTNRDLDRLRALAAQGLSMSRREGDGTVDRIRALLGEACRHRVHDPPRRPQVEARRLRAWRGQMTTSDKSADTAPTLEAAVSSLTERAAAAEARADQALDLAKRAEQALAGHVRLSRSGMPSDPALKGFRCSWKQLDCSWPNSVP